VKIFVSYSRKDARVFAEHLESYLLSITMIFSQTLRASVRATNGKSF